MLRKNRFGMGLFVVVLVFSISIVIYLGSLAELQQQEAVMIGEIIEQGGLRYVLVRTKDDNWLSLGRGNGSGYIKIDAAWPHKIGDKFTVILTGERVVLYEYALAGK